MNIFKSLFGLQESTDPQQAESNKFYEIFDFRPETELSSDLYYQAEILWRLVLMARELKATAERKVSDPHDYPNAYRCRHAEYRDAVRLARDFCSDMSDIPLHWAALDSYIAKRRAHGMKSHRVFTETLDLD